MPPTSPSTPSAPPDPRQLVVVDSGHPHHPSSAYTRGGVAHRGAGLITFVQDGDTAARIVSALAAMPAGRVRDGSRHRLLVGGEELHVLLAACAPASVARFALLRHDDNPEPHYLQAHVVADRHGAVDLDGCDCCPDLARTGVLWRRPLEFPLGDDEHEPLVTLLDASDGQTVTVDVPVREDGEDLGRLERLAATPLGDGRVRVLQAPVVADWTTAGAVLAVDAGGRVEQVGSNARVHLTVRIERSGLRLDHLDAARIATDRLAALPGTAVTNTGQWLAAAVLPTQAQRARSLLRRLVRDGHATEVGTFSDPAPSPGSCTCCAARVPW